MLGKIDRCAKCGIEIAYFDTEKMREKVKKGSSFIPGIGFLCPVHAKEYLLKIRS